MPNELNPQQKELAETMEGMIVVDAGPGTGKTHTIVERYINLISRPDVMPADVLLMTFTNNAASEMDLRIKKTMSENDMEEKCKFVQTKTFDAFCLSVVLESPELVSDFFDAKEKLTHSAMLSQNDTLNKDYFRQFLDRFLHDRGEDYGDYAVIAAERPDDLMNLLTKLMSRGIIPVSSGWTGMNCDKDLIGDADAIIAGINAKNVKGNRNGDSAICKKVKETYEGGTDHAPEFSDEGNELSDVSVREAAEEDRTELLRFVHDVFLAYIRRNIADNRLTFGLNAMFAYAILYSNQKVRERNSVRYLIVDEFQDTNTAQMMICLMIMSEPNLCVVGDWKQGIYGFRYVSIENIIDFENRAVTLRRYLNSDGEKRVVFSIPDTKSIRFVNNYRSSQEIIDNAFRCMTMKATTDDKTDFSSIRDKIQELTAGRTDIGDKTHIRFVQSPRNDDEISDTIKSILDYVSNDDYRICDGETHRTIGFGDIAVMCRNTKQCRMIHEACAEKGIPSFLQGDVEIMSTREGKLALAWLRYVNNESDPWGFVPIMADMDYTPIQIAAAQRGDIPEMLREQRKYLYRKKRRITELLTSIFAYYSLDNDVTQSIISTMSSIHRGSLLTISDIIRIMEDDIENGSVYPVENYIDGRAVTIMTMHKSKGLEFPVVICPFIDAGKMPSTKGESRTFFFDSKAGVRCTKEIGRFGDYSKICNSWRTAAVKASLGHDYNEERRLMFVAMSRAKQYETLICGPRPSEFMKELSGGNYQTIPDTDADPSEFREPLSDMPEIPDYPKRRLKMGVHDILRFEDEDGNSASGGTDEVCGKGMEYGTEIHRIAELMQKGKFTEKCDYPEIAEIRKVLDAVSDADLVYSEIECGLPLDDPQVTLRGVIDMLAIYPDRIEIHDYKTDVSDRFQQEYVMQLSVYAQAASAFYNKPVECYIDYVSRGISVPVEPLPLSAIKERTASVLKDVLNED